jgi:hypothetical protein
MNWRKTLLTLAILAAASSVASAQECRSMPVGSQERRTCLMSQPAFQAKVERCKQLARERGDTARTGTGAGGMKEFVRDCVRGRQH